MICQPRDSLQSRAASLQAEMHMYNAQIDLHQYLTHKRRMRRGGQRRRYWSGSWLRTERQRQFGTCDQLLENAFANLTCWILPAHVDVGSVFGLSVMHPVRVLIVRYMFVCCPSLIRRHFACWTEAVCCIFVTCTFQPFHVRWMYVRSFGFSTGLTFLPPDNKNNSYPFHVRRFNPVKCDRGLMGSYQILYAIA